MPKYFPKIDDKESDIKIMCESKTPVRCNGQVFCIYAFDD